MKLIVSDFDGTYFNNEESVLKNNEYINEFRKNNNLFMLSSGRSFKSLKNMTNLYNIKYDYLSCCDGSILYDNKDNIVTKFTLNNSILKKFLNLKKYAKIERIQYSYDDDYYSSEKNGELIGCNFVINVQNVTTKFLKEYEKLKDMYKEFDFLAYTHDDITFFCLKNKGINKSSTIKYLKDYLNLEQENIYTFGDGDNDYPMLKDFNGYYIGEVSKDIKEICKNGYEQVYEFFQEKND